MADEIDIEEHDIMDHPIIKDMFPDLSVIKKEIIFYENEFETIALSRREDNLCRNVRPSEEDELLSNRIILGSKPNKVSVDENYFEKWVKPYSANVVLHDIRSYLHNSKRYCKTCYILFPEQKDFEKHRQIYHPEELQEELDDMIDSKLIIRRCEYICDICTRKFATSISLRKHKQNNHFISAVNNNRALGLKNRDRRKFGKRHNNDDNNTCFHCKETFKTQKALIEHLYDIIQTQKKTPDVVPVLDSVLFKCNKCDIHFVSSQVAANHSDHMEWLINWKCSVCSRIFKREDELSHERQHSVSNSFVTYDLGQIAPKILFRCLKCHTHFDEAKYLYHFRDCELNDKRSEYCKICDIKLDSDMKLSHDSAHKYTDLNINHFTVIETEVISDSPVKAATSENHLKNKTGKTDKLSEVKVVLQRLDTNELVTYKQPSMDQRIESHVGSKFYEPDGPSENGKGAAPGKLTIEEMRNNTNNNHRNYKINDKSKANGMWKHLVKKRSVSKHDDKVVRRKRNLAYSYCEACKCFITKFKRDMHIQSQCTNMQRHVCRYCGLVFTSTSLLTHSRLHELRRDLKLKDFKFYNLYNGQQMNPPIPEYPNCTVCGVHFLSKNAKNNHACSSDAYLTCQHCEIKLSEAAFKLHMTFHHYSTKVSKPPDFGQAKVDFKERDMNLQKELSNVCDTWPKNSVMILYTCRNCAVTVDDYDKVVEHCQGHYETEEKKRETEACQFCALEIDKTCLQDHYDQHEKGHSFNVLKFDSYYFPSENNKWVEHMFKDIPKEKVTEILRKSIYRYECRIKMDVIQPGSPDLTVYKCDQCHCFIEPSSLFKHADNSCFKLRKHACSFCGLPFISAAARTEHETIHKRPGITLKSYRIVLFNRDQDKQFNSSICFRKRYVLYQCRSCNGIIDKLETHLCDVNDLKKCSKCGLLLYSQDYELHLTTHKEFDSFNPSNMKVILLGECRASDETLRKIVKSDFQGLVNDYKMYKCIDCQICVKNELSIPKHSCKVGSILSKCQICHLFFSMGRIKTHTKSHERDPDFVRSNMTIVLFDPSSDNQKNMLSKLATVNGESSDDNTDSDSDIVSIVEQSTEVNNGESSGIPEDVQKKVVIYKCTCGLHFLNEESITRHFGACKSKIRVSRQTCPKCGLMFTPNVLFTHLLAHHSNKNHCFKYDVIEYKK